MKGRGLVVFLALILATLATAGVFMYSRGVKEEAKTGGTMVQVVVANEDIPARTDLDQLIKDEQFRIIQVPETAVVSGAITSIDQLRGQNNSAAIVAGEQIPEARITGELQGGALSIPPGKQALSVALDGPRAVTGAIGVGDHVAIYATFKDVPQDIDCGFAIGLSDHGKKCTLALVPSVEILAVNRPLGSGTLGTSGVDEQVEQIPSSLSLTLALDPEDAEHFVFSLENGSVWLGLLPPDEDGTQLEPISYAQVIG
jgi:Flp pilus assembly protein CpaB